MCFSINTSKDVWVVLVMSMYFMGKRKCFFLRHVQFDSWYNVMTINEFSCDRPNCLTYTVGSLFVRTPPVGRHHRRRTPWCPHCRQLSRVTVLLTDHMHTRSWINYKLSFFRLSCWRSREYPFLRGKIECSLVFFFELVHVLGKIPRLTSGTSLLSCSLFVGPTLKFFIA